MSSVVTCAPASVVSSPKLRHRPPWSSSTAPCWAYLSHEDRERIAEQLSATDAVWISNEAPGVLPTDDLPQAPTDAAAAFLVSRIGRPTAWADPHGSWFRRLPTANP